MKAKKTKIKHLNLVVLFIIAPFQLPFLTTKVLTYENTCAHVIGEKIVHMCLYVCLISKKIY